jgi:hypothetical protein
MNPIPRGVREMPPNDNNQGWMKRVNVFTAKGTEQVNIRVWEYPDGRPCEIYLSTSKQNTQTDQFLRELGKDWSRLLQYGVDICDLIHALTKEPGPLGGSTDTMGDCLSVQDLVGKALKVRYCPKD